MDNPITQELIKPDSDIERKNEKNSVDQNTALIVSKYMNDDQTAKLIWTCKKYRELFDLRFFNYDDLTQQTMGYYNIDNLEKVYIYNNPKIALQLYNQNRIKKLINYVPEAFENEGFNLPSNTVNIPAYRFYQKNFIYNNPFYIPSYITSIGKDAFAWTDKLRRVYFGRSSAGKSNVKSIKSGAFSPCSDLESIAIPSSVTNLGGWCFSHCTALTEACLYCPIDILPSNTFANCISLTSIILPTSITRFVSHCFENCVSLREINLPSNLEEIGISCFYGCVQLQNITLPSTLTEIDPNAFEKCTSLQEIDIPNGVTEIPRCCFFDCESLHTVHLPSNLRVIRTYAFRECLQLQRLVLPNARVVLERLMRSPNTVVTIQN